MHELRRKFFQFIDLFFQIKADLRLNRYFRTTFISFRIRHTSKFSKITLYSMVHRGFSIIAVCLSAFLRGILSNITYHRVDQAKHWSFIFIFLNIFNFALNHLYFTFYSIASWNKTLTYSLFSLLYAISNVNKIFTEILNVWILTFRISFIFVNCRPNSHRSTPNFSAQFRTLKK